MRYVSVPREISSHDVRANGFSLSPGMYRSVHIPNPNTKTVRELLNPLRPYDKGTEPGSFFYMKHSPYAFIRTKALQAHSTLLYPKGESIVPLNPRGITDWTKFDLHDGDLLMAKDSNVGECVMVDGDKWNNHAWSNGVVRLHPNGDRFYFFAWLKHSIFKEQLLSMLPRGATILHAKDLWLDCVIPFPNQTDAERVVRYVSTLMQAVVDKEKAIRDKNAAMFTALDTELIAGQNGGVTFQYKYPTNHGIQTVSRLDAAMYVESFQRKQFLMQNYKHGYTNAEGLGLQTGRGQNLQLSCIGKSIYSDMEKPNFYRLLLPTNITDYGTVSFYEWLGNRRELSVLNEGDIVFGGEATFRCVVVCDALSSPTISNIHAITLRSNTLPLYKKVFVGTWASVFGPMGLFAVCSSGGQRRQPCNGIFSSCALPQVSR